MRSQHLHLPSVVSIALALLLLPKSEQSIAQEIPCGENPVVSVPSRPSASTSTETTHCGIVEFDGGGQRTWLGDGARQETVLFGLRIGITPKLDLHWQGGSYVNVVDSGGGARGGFGENWFGAKYRILEQTKHRPGFGVFYNAKVPTTDRADAFGTARFDQALSLLFSKDIRKIHLDLNVTPFLAGRAGAAGHDFNTGFALGGSVPLAKHFTFLCEGYGATFLNPSVPAFASTTAAFTYTVNPRLVLDAGSDWGVTHEAPRQRIFGGVTFAMGNAYRLVRPNRANSQ